MSNALCETVTERSRVLKPTLTIYTHFSIHGLDLKYILPAAGYDVTNFFGQYGVSSG